MTDHAKEITQPAPAPEAKGLSRSRTFIMAVLAVVVFVLNQLVGQDIITHEFAQEVLLMLTSLATLIFRMDADAPLKIPGLRKR